MGRLVTAALAAWLGAGCLSIAALDEDYVLGPSGAGGGSGGGQTVVSASSGGSATSAGGATASTSTSVTSSSTGGGSCTGTHEYLAVVADCIELPSPDPDACEAVYGPSEMMISTSAYTIGTPFRAYVRFDLDPMVAQSPLASITLRLVVASTIYADSGNSGEVWQVVPFERADLFSGPPSAVGSTAIAGSVGAANLGDTLDWTLPTNIVDGDSVYLELRPLVSDQTDYVNANGASPPKLIVECP